MKYRVIGSKTDTGARMTLEFEALSKADAERKAKQSGMVVNHVEVEVGTVEKKRVPIVRSKTNPLLSLIVFVMIAAAMIYWLYHHGVLPAWRR